MNWRTNWERVEAGRQIVDTDRGGERKRGRERPNHEYRFYYRLNKQQLLLVHIFGGGTRHNRRDRRSLSIVHIVIHAYGRGHRFMRASHKWCNRRDKTYILIRILCSRRRQLRKRRIKSQIAPNCGAHFLRSSEMWSNLFCYFSAKQMYRIPKTRRRVAHINTQRPDECVQSTESRKRQAEKKINAQ